MKQGRYKTRKDTIKKWCFGCSDIRTFANNRKIGHSSCVSCGFRFGIKKKDLQKILIKHFFKKSEISIK